MFYLGEVKWSKWELSDFLCLHSHSSHFPHLLLPFVVLLSLLSSELQEKNRMQIKKNILRMQFLTAYSNMPYLSCSLSQSLYFCVCGWGGRRKIAKDITYTNLHLCVHLNIEKRSIDQDQTIDQTTV